MYIVGIDEVGRGSLAGPVVVGAVALPVGKKFINLRDSKKLTPRARENWFDFVKGEKDIFYATARVYHNKIDKVNIAEAANAASTKAFLKLISRSKSGDVVKVYLDGGLYLNEEVVLKKIRSAFRVKTVIKGDEKINSIKLASIMAKVTRDRYMVKLHDRYPRYGFNLHKGYGTEIHRRAIKRYGLSKIHRRSFKSG